MKPYFKERLENAICFLASEHYRRTKEYLYQTTLYKYLAFFEIRYLRKTGEAPLGLKYLAMERGPVPIELYRNRTEIRSDKFKFIPEGEGRYKIKAVDKADLDFFSEDEIEELRNVIEIFAQRWVRTREMSDASHQDILSWKKAYQKKPNSSMDLQDEFPELEKKTSEELSAAEERFLMNQAIRSLYEGSWNLRSET